MRDGYNQPQIGVDHPLACFGIAFFHFLCELGLLLHRQKRKPPDISHAPAKSGIVFIHAGSYLTERIHRYGASVGFCNAPCETMSVASGEGELTCLQSGSR